jgi:hypothetical protein
MARYAYDVNTTQRYIDVHKQFQGGLKTVDTDDALGAVFLREAENVSISEFGFLEKRYGTYENFKQTFSGNLQGYWEFEGYIIYAVDGDLFVNGTQITTFHTEAGLRYPTNDNIPFNVTSTCAFVNTGSAYLEPPFTSLTAVADPSTSPTCGSDVTKISCVCQDFLVGEGCVQWSCQNSVGTLTYTTIDHFQRDRDMNAVNINKVLYIFTGTYPVYAKVEKVNNQDVLKFYLFPVTVPTFDEIVVTGHNLLEDDYEGLYFPEQVTLEPASDDATLEEKFVLKEGEKGSFPKIPFVIDKNNERGTLSLESSFKYHKNLEKEFTGANLQPVSNPEFPFTSDDEFLFPVENLYTLNVENVSFRSTGVGASFFDFQPLDLAQLEYENINNIFEDKTFFVNDPRYAFRYLEQQPVSNPALVTALNEAASLNNYGYAYDISKEYDFSTEFLKANKKYGIKFSYASDDVLEPFKTLNIEIAKDTLRNAAPSNQLVNFRNSLTQDYRLIITPYRFSVPGEFSNKFYFEEASLTLNKNQIEYDEITGMYSFEFPNFPALSISGFRIQFFNPLFFMNEFFGENNYPNEVFQTEDIDRNIGRSPVPHPSIFISFFEALEFKKETAFQDVDYLKVKINSLISGTFDFLVSYKFTHYENSQTTFKIIEEKIINLNLNNITITQEKLQDFPRKDANSIGIDYPTLKPIWTCNKVTEHFGKLMVWGSTAMPTAVFYSFPDRPSYFPSKFFLDFTNDQNSPVEAVSSYMNILVVQTRDQTWGVRGNSGLLTAPAPYAPFTINPTVGTIAYKSVRAVRNHLFFLSKQGIIALKSLYAADEQYNIEFVDRNILNIVPRDDDSAVGIQFDNQYWLNFPKQRITLRWYIDKKAWVKDTYGAWNQFNGVFKYQIVDGKLEFITYPSLFDGENLGVYKIGVDYSLPTDLGADIVALFETAFLNQNYPFHPKNYKETKMDFTVQNEYNLGRDPIYTMETNEDINPEDQNLHTLVAPNLTKNHRYQLKYEAYIIDGGAFDTDFTNLKEVDGGAFTDTLTRVIDAMGIYKLGIGAINLQSTPQSTNIPFTEISETTYEFLLANNVPIGKDLTISREFIGYSGGAVLTDITYDHVLDFRTWIISEDNTLNLDNMEGYDQSKAEIPIQLGAKFGDWVFGLSDLGNKVTAIKTIKLAGRGYNVKVYFEDYSKSKWTLESLGITYKMKRPRSR